MYYIIAIVLGLLIGLSLTFIFSKLPEAWLQDYGADPNSPKYRLSKRMEIWPHGVCAGLFCALFYVAVVFKFPSLIANGNYIHLIAIILTIPVLFLVLISDKLNRIIPDQFWVIILIFGILFLISDYVEGSIWFSEEVKWYVPLVNRILGAALGSGFLWLIGFIAETFMAKEAMGHGDMKLLIGCGFCTGAYGLVVLTYVAVIIGVIFAIPLLIRKQKRLKEEEEYVRNSEDPRLARLELRQKAAEVHFADDPDYLAFGPFLAIGAGVFIALEPVFFKLMYQYLFVFNLLF